MTKITDGMEHLSFAMRNAEETRHWKVGFTGRWLISPVEDQHTTSSDEDVHGCWAVAQTAKGQILVYWYHVTDGTEPHYQVYSSLDEARGHVPDDIVAIAAAELGPGVDVELDI